MDCIIGPYPQGAHALSSTYSRVPTMVGHGEAYSIGPWEWGGWWRRGRRGYRGGEGWWWRGIRGCKGGGGYWYPPSLSRVATPPSDTSSIPRL